jgi:hypothetical protein
MIICKYDALAKTLGAIRWSKARLLNPTVIAVSDQVGCSGRRSTYEKMLSLSIYSSTEAVLNLSVFSF